MTASSTVFKTSHFLVLCLVAIILTRWFCDLFSSAFSLLLERQSRLSAAIWYRYIVLLVYPRFSNLSSAFARTSHKSASVTHENPCCILKCFSAYVMDHRITGSHGNQFVTHSHEGC
jgi:hypothetical protein